MASVIENRNIRGQNRHLSKLIFAQPTAKSTSEKSLESLVRNRYFSIRHRLRDTQAKYLARYEYHPEFDGRLIGPVRTSTTYVPNVYFNPNHAIDDEPIRLHDIYSPWSWPYVYQDSPAIRKDPQLQGAQAVEPWYKNRSRSYFNSQSRANRYYAAEVDQYIRDSERATDSYLRWSLGVESKKAPYYRSYYDESGLLGRLGYHRPSIMQRYVHKV